MFLPFLHFRSWYKLREVFFNLNFTDGPISALILLFYFYLFYLTYFQWLSTTSFGDMETLLQEHGIFANWNFYAYKKEILAISRHKLCLLPEDFSRELPLYMDIGNLKKMHIHHFICVSIFIWLFNYLSNHHLSVHVYLSIYLSVIYLSLFINTYSPLYLFVHIHLTIQISV